MVYEGIGAWREQKVRKGGCQRIGAIASIDAGDSIGGAQSTQFLRVGVRTLPSSSIAMAMDERRKREKNLF